MHQARDDADEDVVSDGHSATSNWMFGPPWAPIPSMARVEDKNRPAVLLFSYIERLCPFGFLERRSSTKTSLFGLPFVSFGRGAGLTTRHFNPIDR